jgi:LAS superfamily LD-carboxypeptidase LdcB
MSKLMIALFVTAGLSVAGCAMQRDAPMAAAKPMAPAAPITKDAYEQVVKNADAQYKMDKDALLTANRQRRTSASPKPAARMIAKADAEAAYKSTPKARDARVTRAKRLQRLQAEM